MYHMAGYLILLPWKYFTKVGGLYLRESTFLCTCWLNEILCYPNKDPRINSKPVRSGSSYQSEESVLHRRAVILYNINRSSTVCV